MVCRYVPSVRPVSRASAEPTGVDGPVDAVTEVRRLTSLHHLTDTPGLADALTAAERGEHVTVDPDSPLGRHVRTWLTESRRASWSMNDHSGRWLLFGGVAWRARAGKVAPAPPGRAKAATMPHRSRP